MTERPFDAEQMARETLDATLRGHHVLTAIAAALQSLHDAHEVEVRELRAAMEIIAEQRADVPDPRETLEVIIRGAKNTLAALKENREPAGNTGAKYGD